LIFLDWSLRELLTLYSLYLLLGYRFASGETLKSIFKDDGIIGYVDYVAIASYRVGLVSYDKPVMDLHGLAWEYSS